MSTAQQLQEAADKATQASSQADTWANGPINTTVPTDSGPVPTIAEFTRANQERADAAINALGWVLAGNFTAGCTVTGRNQYVLEVGGSAYRWDGSLPKTVPPGSSPSPEAAGSWVRILFTSDTPPLPDVWAPLSDSLRLFTGYGREVKVGEDVIARMLTFTRSTTKTYTNRDGVLTTAAVNEPTFDQWGLQLDGQSQNKVVQSKMLPRSLQAGSYTVTPSVVQGYNLHSCVYTSGDDAVVIDEYVTLQAPGSTGSFVFNAATIVGNWTCYFGNTDSYQVFWPKNSADYAYEDLGNGLIRVSRVLKGTMVGALHFRCLAVAGSRVDIGCLQIEELPFASSYIPTSGAAVTRDTDLLTLQNPLNIPVGAGDMTIAVEVRRNPAIPAARFPMIFNISGVTWLVGDSTRFAWRGGTTDQGGLMLPAPSAMETVVYRIKGNQVTVRCGTAVATLTRTGAITPNNMVTNIGSNAAGAQNLFGHVRNLRVWRRALTDDQMKAIV